LQLAIGARAFEAELGFVIAIKTMAHHDALYDDIDSEALS